MLLKGIKYKGRVWDRAAGDTGRFVWGHKIASTASTIVLTIIAHFSIFGETEGFSGIRPVVSLIVGSLGVLSLVFFWKLFWAPFQMEKDRVAESEKIIAHIQSKNAALRNENFAFKNRLNEQIHNLKSMDRLEELFREGEAILKENVGGFETFFHWRERVSSWNDSVLIALPKSERFAFETIAEWPEMTMPDGQLGTGGAVNGYMRNGKAYMHSKMIKLRKTIMGISGR